MLSAYKGLPGAYEDVLFGLYKTHFYEIIKDPDCNKGIRYLKGQLCSAPAWYEKENRWYLEDHNYDPINEQRSTWYARLFNGRIDESKLGYVKKYFNLETGEILISTHGKCRPVILVKHYESNWLHPSIETKKESKWLCLPIFSYKGKHNQPYVLKDQKFECIDRIYIPPEFGDRPGLKNESAIKFESMQMIDSKHLTPLKSMCLDGGTRMQRSFKISDLALKIVMYHFIHNFNLFENYLNDEKQKSQYNEFIEYLNDYLDESA